MVALGVAEPDGRELFEDHRDVVDVEVRSHRAGFARACEHTAAQRVRVGGELVELPGRRERAGELDRERVDVGVDDAGDEHVEAVAGRDRFVEGVLGDRDEAVKPVGAERLQELVLAGVAAVQRAHADAGALRHRRDRR
jgi:hypothetical protein